MHRAATVLLVQEREPDNCAKADGHAPARRHDNLAGGGARQERVDVTVHAFIGQALAWAVRRPPEQPHDERVAHAGERPNLVVQQLLLLKTHRGVHLRGVERLSLDSHALASQRAGEDVAEAAAAKQAGIRKPVRRSLQLGIGHLQGRLIVHDRNCLCLAHLSRQYHGQRQRCSVATLDIGGLGGLGGDHRVPGLLDCPLRRVSARPPH
mmetsp:Transcript_13079/g.45744  ORF Transcript_13079/g.45744 Transcript_13079/m.45744 type:complete len:209 (-) Transcript_13079:2058-2684(-)